MQIFSGLGVDLRVLLMLIVAPPTGVGDLV